MKGIKEYIQFALNNKLSLWDNKNGIIWKWITFNVWIDSVSFTNASWWSYYINIIQLITSQLFIEAIARGLNPNYEIDSPWLYSEIGRITTEQAIAIRDNKLEEYISNLSK